MPRRKKATISTPVESLKHADKRANIPTEELRDFVADGEKRPKAILYPRDPSLDPQLVWKGKDEQDVNFRVKMYQRFSPKLHREVALKEGYGLNCRIEPVAAVTGNTIHRVTDPDKEQSFFICLDNQIDLANLNGLNLSQDDTFVCRDVALDDEAAANLALQCRLKTI